jgi:hypothetical protein
LNRRLGGPQSWSGRFGEEKNICDSQGGAGGGGWCDRTRQQIPGGGKINTSNEKNSNFLRLTNFKLLNHINGSSKNACDFESRNTQYLLVAVTVIN